MKKLKLRTLRTTFHTADYLKYQRSLAANGLPTLVAPAFRTDKALAIHQTEPFNQWLQGLEQAADQTIRNLDSFLQALRLRHDFFHAHGCRLSDHGLDQCYAELCTERAAAAIFAKARRGRTVSP